MGMKIDSQSALIGLNIQYPSVKMSVHPSHITIQPRIDEIKIETDPGRIVVDNDPVREAIGLLDVQALAKKATADSQTAVLKGIRRRVEEGILLAESHQHGCEVAKLAAIAAQNSQLQVDVKATPPAEFTYQRGYLEINVQIKQDQSSFSLGTLELNVEWANVQVYLQQKAYSKMTWTGNILDTLG